MSPLKSSQKLKIHSKIRIFQIELLAFEATAAEWMCSYEPHKQEANKIFLFFSCLEKDNLKMNHRLTVSHFD